MRTLALSDAQGFLNWRWGGGQSLTPPTAPQDANRAAFEHGRLSIGPDETFTAVPHDGGTAVRSPNGRAWLSVNMAGGLEERPASDPSQPGPWETFDERDGRLVERPKDGLDRALVSFGVTVLSESGSDGGGPPVAGGGGQSGFLTVSGASLLNGGQPWQLRAYTIHTLLNNVARGEDISPLLNEAIGYGANTLVVIGMHLSDWKKANGFYYDPRGAGHPAALAALYDTCAAAGIRVWYRVLADAQGVSWQDQQHLWNQAGDVAHGRWNVILTIGNEGPVNGWAPDGFTRRDLGGVLQTKGSAGADTVPYLEPWDVAEYESRRDMPKALLDANCLELAYGGWDANPHGIHCPLANIEPAFFNDVTPDLYGDSRWTDPTLAYKLGIQIGSGCAGGAFGASDGLVARPLQPRAADCARAFFRGLKAGWGI